jgi:hypothetical protein
MIEVGIKRNVAMFCGKCDAKLVCRSEPDNPYDAESNILVYVEPCPCTTGTGDALAGQASLDEANNEIVRLRSCVEFWEKRADNNDEWARKWGRMHDKRLEEYRELSAKHRELATAWNNTERRRQRLLDGVRGIKLGCGSAMYDTDSVVVDCDVLIDGEETK